MNKLFSFLSAGLILMAGALVTSCGDDDPVPSGLAGTWNTTMNVNIVEDQPLSVNVDYVISDNADGSINVVVPDYSLTVQMGPRQMQMNIGSFTVKNIAYDVDRKAYYKAFADGSLGLEFNMVGAPAKTYKFDNSKCTSEITVSATNDGKVSIVNNYSLEGSMPYAIKTSAMCVRK